jgi:glycosyltransferase involved in cell wall biosynthesis
MSTKLVYLTAGAGGMFCGSCLHDNSLARALLGEGWDVQLVPFYTPIRTDEEDVSVDQVFFGGVNVYLQQKFWPFRYLPKWLDGFLDRPSFIRRVTSRAIETNAAVLGSMALSMLRGAGGNQAKEVHRVVKWLTTTARPDLILVTNILVAGFVPALKEQTKAPVIVTLQGDDVFLDMLPPSDRERCLTQIRENNRYIDGFITHSAAYRDYMADYFQIPEDKIQVTPLGLDTRDYRELPTPASKTSGRVIGYFARLAPEKGLQHLIAAFIELKRDPAYADVKLQLAGWLSPECRGFAEDQWDRLRKAGLERDFEYRGVLERREKLEFMQLVDLLCVPVEHQEPKGLFALESLAAGTPVVLPRRGGLTEIVEESGGGLLFEHHDLPGLVASLKKLLDNPELRQRLGQQGRQHILESRNEKTMAQNTIATLRRYLI